VVGYGFLHALCNLCKFLVTFSYQCCCMLSLPPVTESLHWSFRVQISQAARNNSNFKSPINFVYITESWKWGTLLSPPQLHYTWISSPVFFEHVVVGFIRDKSLFPTFWACSTRQCQSSPSKWFIKLIVVSISRRLRHSGDVKKRFFWHHLDVRLVP
jgi:hypothetical protein